jgi:hypothetical protein
MPAELPPELHAVAIRFADHMTERIADRPTTDFLGTVAAWNAGTGVLTVNWRGSTTPLPAKRHAAYTPAVGDWVHCSVLDGQIIVQDRVV